MTEDTFKPEYLLPGTLVGGYRVCTHLGSGSGVVVYDVMSQAGNHYALKISRFRPGVQGSRGRVMDGRLGRCILCLQQLKGCQYVAQLRAYDRYPDPLDGWQYLVQDLVTGGMAITEWVWRNTPPVAQVIQICRALAETCGRMADAGICHRDIKPSNILVTRDGTPMIVDFNSASCSGVEPLTRSALDQPVTLIYAPPELASAMYEERVYGQPEPFRYLPAGDLHALGCLLYEVLTADHPFNLGDDDERLQLREIAQKTPMHPHLLNPAVPFAVEKVVMRLLKKSPSDRYQHGSQVARDLQFLLDNLGTKENWQQPFTVPRGDDAPGPLRLRTATAPPVEAPQPEPIPVPDASVAPPSEPAPEVAAAPTAVQAAVVAEPVSAPVPSAALPATSAPRLVETRQGNRRRRVVAVAASFLVGLVLWKGLPLMPRPAADPLAKLTVLLVCGVFNACAGAKIRTEGLDWLASCSKQARKAVAEVPLPEIKAPYFDLEAPAKLQPGPNVIIHRAGVEIRPGPIVALVSLSGWPSRWARLYGVANTGADGASLRFDKMVVYLRGDKALPPEERSEFPICALGGKRGHWPGLYAVRKDSPNRVPDSELHTGYVYVTTSELEIRLATESGAPVPNM